MIRLTPRQQAGFTLVELIVAMLMTGILTLVVMNFMAHSLVQSTIESARAELLGEAQLTLDSANDDIRLSAAADDANRWPDAHAPNAPSDPYSWDSTASTVILATAAEDSQHNILFEDASKYITYKDNLIYFVSGGILYKRTLASPEANNSAKTSCPQALASASCPADKVLLHNVTSFTVRYLNGLDQTVTPSDARSIEMSVQLQVIKYRHPITASYTTRTVFRND
jgi:prepilin-type N-terminal cleavage/methylation domain-containing protein